VERAANAHRAAKGDLTSLLYDNLQAPLANIKSAALTLQSTSRRGEPGAQQEMLRLITHEAETLHEALTLAEELRQLRSAEDLRLSPIELSDLLMSALATWKPLAPNHSFELAMPGEVPPITGDEEQFKRALHFLIDAAVRFAPTGGTVRVDIRPHPDEVLVSVRHHGQTPTEEALARFFEPFYRHAAGLDALAGGGLGLALVEAVVAAHGGHVWAETPTSGPGAVTYIALPYVPPCMHTPPPPEGLPPAFAASAPVSQPRVRPAVLILEGEPRMQRYLRANLDAQQYRVAVPASRSKEDRPHVASDLAEAERLIDLEDPALILLDTGFGGGPFLHTLRHLLEYAAAPVVVLARRHDPLECARALDLGAVDYLARPLSMDELLARLRVALRTREALVHTQTHEPIFQHDGLVIDFEQRGVSVDGKPATLSKTEFKLLRVLAQHPKMVLSHEVLLERVWGPGYGNEVEFVWVYIRRLRRKIEPDPSHPRYILTVPGVGYRLGCAS
jgi:DNA-binding response OmpR family regulator